MYSPVGMHSKSISFTHFHLLPSPTVMTSTPAPMSLPPLSVDGLLHAHAASQDPKLAALKQAHTERIGLKTKNEQLWKLIEKQRAGYNQLIQELERMRSERDAYKTKVVASMQPGSVSDRKADNGAALAVATATTAHSNMESPMTPRPRHT
ncbi:hypothetical protein R3P38DRAFT_2837649 [Favolaschia claudopus]|uniref:Uncharacterized protein n=1 Tax=Favolaschia claudopus TaxID=2862362 RepID=A0AAW0E619_9AGAR